MIVLFCSFIILSNYSWGRYAVLLCIALIAVCQAIRDGKNYRLVFGAMPFFIAAFVIYAFLSSVWAIDASDSLTMDKTLFEIFLMVWVCYNYYHSSENAVEDLLFVIKWAGYIIVIYTILYYGIDQLMFLSANETRLDNAYTNVNIVGMLASITVLLQIDEITRKKRFVWSSVFVIPSILLLGITQSRKAFLMLLIGLVLYFLLISLRGSFSLQKFGKMFFLLSLAVALIYIVFALPVFSGMLVRMQGMIAGFTGEGKIDHSTELRLQMVELGIYQFKKTPLLGTGIGTPHLLCLQYLGKDTYLHNNFVELLCGGGLVGFCVYYAAYAYLLVRFFQLRKFQTKTFPIVFTIFIGFLVMDYGRVSYYQKQHYIYLLLYFCELASIKKKASRIKRDEEAEE
jgi:O-antigen ligase